MRTVAAVACDECEWGKAALANGRAWRGFLSVMQVASPKDATLPSLPPLTIYLFMFLLTQTNTQGRVRTRTVKRASRHIIERFYARLTLDFDTNKRVCDEIAVIQSKRLRNKIAGFTTVRDRPRAH